MYGDRAMVRGNMSGDSPRTYFVDYGNKFGDSPRTYCRTYYLIN